MVVSHIVPDREELEQKSQISLRELAKEYKVSHELVRKWFQDYGIKKQRPVRKQKVESPGEEALIGMSTLSYPTIAVEYNTSTAVVNRWYKKSGVPKLRPYKQEINLSQEDLNNKPVRQIAKENNVSIQTINRRISELGIKKNLVPTAGRIRKPAPPKEELESLCLLSYSEIARRYEVYPKTVRKWFENYGIARVEVSS